MKTLFAPCKPGANHYGNRWRNDEMSTMKLKIEITGMSAGVIPEKDGQDARSWVMLMGKDGRNRFAKAFLGGKAAEEFSRQIKESLAPGEDISSLRPLYELEGSWQSKEREHPETGEVINDRSFRAKSFTPIKGRDYEVAMIRRQAFKSIKEAEKQREAGDLAQAYKIVASLVADLGHVDLQLPELEEAMDAQPSPDEVFGEEAPSPEANADVNPEKAAADHYRADDVLKGGPENEPKPTEEMKQGLDATEAAEAAPVEPEEAPETAPVEEPAVEAAAEEEVAPEVENDASELEDAPAPSPRRGRPGRPGRPGRAPVAA